MKITIKDIAKKCDVSIGTVSKILNEKYKYDNIKISQETIARVKKVAKEMNYEPNYAGRLLSTGKTNTIGIYIPKSREKNFHFGHYYSSIIDSIEKSAVKSGYDILLINYDSYIHKFSSRRIDGLIIIEQWEMDDELGTLVQEGWPFVIINNLLEEPYNLHAVNIDNNYAMHEIVKYFKNNNHQNLAFIEELIPVPQREHKLRFKYFVYHLQAEGLPVYQDLFLISEKGNFTPRIEEENYDQLSGYYGMEYLLDKFQGQFTGVFCANDLIALGALNYLYESGIKVPNEMSIIGFDDLDFSKSLVHGLTTVRQPFAKLGQEAFLLLTKIMKGQTNSANSIVRIKPELIIRNTVSQLEPVFKQ
ncbi:MAG: LacI family DNA-binding transcriptional regulator [Spirochaetes bacterium]|nr:LacI family DNA-binding transcriptional regulator [Spirochaetota bacterium]